MMQKLFKETKFPQRVAGYLLDHMRYDGIVRKNFTGWSEISINEACAFCAKYLEKHWHDLLLSPSYGHGAGISPEKALTFACSLKGHEKESFLNSCAENISGEIANEGGFTIAQTGERWVFICETGRKTNG